VEFLMSPKAELYITSDDAVLLRRLLSERALVSGSDETMDALLATLNDAQVVEPQALPPGTVGLNSTLTYEELPTQTLRRVTLVEPRHADPGQGRISVLSPIGRALLGQVRGRLIEVELPAGRRMTIRLLETANAGAAPINA
jgi:regulator of nucleoside diphosphate kinase